MKFPVHRAGIWKKRSTKTNWLQLLTTTIFVAKLQSLLRPHMHLGAFPQPRENTAAYLVCLWSFLMPWFPSPWVLPHFRLMIKMDYCLKFQFDVQPRFLGAFQFHDLQHMGLLGPNLSSKTPQSNWKVCCEPQFLRGILLLPVYKVHRYVKIQLWGIQKRLLPIRCSHHQ